MGNVLCNLYPEITSGVKFLGGYSFFTYYKKARVNCQVDRLMVCVIVIEGGKAVPIEFGGLGVGLGS